MRHRHALLVTSGAILLSACQTIESRPIDPLLQPVAPALLTSGSGEVTAIDGGECADSNAPLCPGATGKPTPPPTAPALPPGQQFDLNTVAEGMIYFLPRRLAKVTAKRTRGTVDDAFKVARKAQTTVDATKAAAAAINAEIAAVTAMRIEQATNAAAVAIYSARLTELNIAKSVAETAASTAVTALTTAETSLKALLAGSVGPVAGASTVTVAIEMLPMSADPAFGFRLRPLHMAQRDDEHKLTVSPAGLLTTTDIIAADRTGDILVELAQIAGMLTGNGFSTKGDNKDSGTVASPCASSLDVVTSIVDFTDPEAVKQLNKDLECMYVRLVPAATVSTRFTKLAPGAAATPGIATRMPVDMPLRIEQCMAVPCGTFQYQLSEIRYVSLPQAGPIGYVRQDAGFFTRSTYKLGFADGVLVSYDAKRPSEILEIARTPLRIVDALFSGFSKIISLRTGQNDQRVAMSASELATLMSLSKDQAAAETFVKCVSEKTAAGEPIAACLPPK